MTANLTSNKLFEITFQKMARNSEKAMTALARWRDLKLTSEGGGSEKFTGVRRRPFLAEECSDIR